MRDRSNVARGRWGEARAAAHLCRNGYRILDRGWRSPERHVRGDIDLIAISADRVLVFCEVKARRAAGSFGGAAAAVGAAKQVQVRMLAESWLRTRGSDLGGTAGPDVGGFDTMRFDVVAIDGVRLTHLEGAF